MIRRLIAALLGEQQSDHPLDFVPVQADDKKAQRRHAQKLAQARERHGKEFRTHTRHARETEPSRDLQDLNAKSKPLIALPDSVLPIRKQQP